tara:strand:+ start:1533 stop:2468 length:936 start_codon:yes stop_codon:yes gene_type:complete
MNSLIFLFLFLSVSIVAFCTLVLFKDRSYRSKESVANSYDKWTNDNLLERLWGEHIHLGYYNYPSAKNDFRKAKIEFVHQLVRWSGLDSLPRGSRILDIGCGIGGSARILANDYGFDVLGITISPQQVRRANELTQEGTRCRFEVMDAMDLQLEKGSFDGVWSVEAGPHIPDKQIFADQMLRVLRPGGVLALADWNRRDPMTLKYGFFEKFVLRQLLNQWTHPEFATINGFRRNLLNSPYCGGNVETQDWTKFTIPSWNDSIIEGIRRPNAILGLGPKALFQASREIPTIIMMRWAFANKLMQFGVFRTRG